MSYVCWCDMFSIKFPSIDRQHMKLIEITDDFHKALVLEKGHQSIFKTFNKLVTYAEKHFKDEETIMEKIGYPEKSIKRHKILHGKLIEEIFSLHDTFKNNVKTDLYEIEYFLNRWLVCHMLREDKKLEPYCRRVITY